MRRVHLAIFLIIAFAARGSGASETARHAILGRMFTTGDYWGPPGEVSAPFACAAGTERSTYYDTTAHVAYFCNGSAWRSMDASATGAHALLSASHSDTLAAAVVRGDIIRGNSTPAWSRLPLGSSGLYLKSNGTDVLYSTLAAGGVGSCTNQFVSALNADSAPTCATVPLATATDGNMGAKALYFTETDNGNSGTSKTINWTTGGIKQKITTTGSCTLTFTAPPGPTTLQLRIVHEASATAYTYTWPGTVKWPNATAVTTTNSSGAVDVVTCYYDGTNYDCVGNANFS